VKENSEKFKKEVGEGINYLVCPRCSNVYERNGGCSIMKCSTCLHSWCVMCELPSDSWFHYIQVGGLNCQILNILRYEIKTFAILKMVLFLFLITIAPLLLYMVFIMFGISMIIKNLEDNNLISSYSQSSIDDRPTRIFKMLILFFIYIIVFLLSFIVTNLIFPFTVFLMEISLLLTFFRMIQLMLR